MNYRESEEIFSRVKTAERVLVTCHFEPDLDSIGSSLALAMVLERLGAEVRVVCKDEISGKLGFMPGIDRIGKVDYRDFDYGEFDLYLCPDSASWDMVTEDDEIERFKLPTIVIDHHASNKSWGDINLLDAKAASATEVLYLLFEDWGVEIGADVATNLVVGIVGDTGGFQYRNVTARTLGVSSRLVELGGDKDTPIREVFQTFTFEHYKYWAEVLKRLEIDRDLGLVWSAIPNDVYVEKWNPKILGVAGMFFQQIEKTKMGVYMTEEEPGFLTVSFRARSDKLDMSKLAQFFGGGGHKKAAGASVEGLRFDEAVERVLSESRKFIKEHDKS